MKTALVVIGVALLHFVISFMVFIATFGDSMRRFDTGESATVPMRFLALVSEVLHFPIVKVFEWLPLRWETTAAQYFPFVANSLLWGLSIVWVGRKLRRGGGS